MSVHPSDQNQLLYLAQHWWHGFQGDLLRYAVAAPLTWLVLCVALAPLLKSWKIRPDRPPLTQHLVELFCSVRSVAIFSTVTLITVGLESGGLLWGKTMRQEAGLVWTLVSLVLTILAHDAYFYWAHRLMHRPRLFRSFHRRHHRSFNPTPFTAYSFDLGEAAVMAAFSPLWLILVPVAWPAFGLFMLHQIARNVIGHSGYELFPADRQGRPLLDWMTTVTHHDLHHAQAGSNFGLYFTWWDRWMGTENPAYLQAFARVAARRRLTGTAGNATVD
ncbi:MAG: sterol desaturase family protein [Caulobacter sp.]|nr:sterol desaturase family protein [Caulobacter sp.]